MIYFYTVTTVEQIHLCDNLKKSLKRHGHDLTILPLYEKNNLSKLNISYVFLTNEYKEDDIIVVCDGFDVVCCKDPIVLGEYLEKHDVDIVFSSENMFGNNLTYIKEYYDRHNDGLEVKGKYLNAGVVFGKANKIKAFYIDVFDSIDVLRQYIPPDRRENTGDQTYIINFIYHYDVLGEKNDNMKYRVMIDLKDDVTFTNTIVEREYNVFDYVFIHTWGIYIADVNYKYIRDQQYKKWQDINTLLKIE